MSIGGGAGVPMTAGSATMVRTRTPPALTAQVVLGAVVVVNLVIVELLFLTAGTGKNAVLTVAKFFGLHAALIMMLQLVLVARLPWLDRRIGMDRLTAWHRWIGFTLLWTLLAHATLIVLGYATLERRPVLRDVPEPGRRDRLAARDVRRCRSSSSSRLSVRYARRRLRYETWHAIHLGLYVAVVLALAHQMLEGTTFTSSPLAAAYWWTLWALVLGALVVGRVVLPLWRNARHRFRVAAVVPESDNGGVGLRHGTRPRPAAGPGRPVLHLAVP